MVILAFVFLVLFIVWQFKLLQKYALKYDRFKINIREKYVCVNGQKIYFSEIDHVRVKELPQPSVVEKALSKSAFYTYMAELTFCLKDGTVVPCVFNYKGILYKTLKQLSVYVPVPTNIDIYKPRVAWWQLVFLLGVIIFVLLMKSKAG